MEGVVALTPGYLHKQRVALLEELFENLDVSGDGSLDPVELQPAFTAISDEILRSGPGLATTQRCRPRYLLAFRGDPPPPPPPPPPMIDVTTRRTEIGP